MIQLFKPILPVEEIQEALRPVLASGWIGPGPQVEKFEAEMAQLVGARYFVALSSGTAALHIAAQLTVEFGYWKPDQTIWLNPVTYASTAACLHYVGLQPHFKDFGREVDLPVHLGGFQAKHQSNEVLFEDCAHALGTELGPHPPIGRCWSFNEKKNLPIGQGGGFSTNSLDFAQEARRLRWLGIDRSTYERSQGASYLPDYSIPRLGWNYAMNDIQATLGLVLLKHLPQQNARRREIAQLYHAGLQAGDWLHIGPTREAAGENLKKSSCLFLPILFKNRKRIAAACQASGIQVGFHYKRLDFMEPFRAAPRGLYLPGVKRYQREQLTLPLHPGLSDEDVKHVIQTVNQAS